MPESNTIQEYANALNISLDEANIRINYYNTIREKIHASKKCPLCGKHTLEYDPGEWEVGVSDAIYCENDEMDCEYASDVEPKHLFIGELDMDEPLLFAQTMDINNANDVYKEVYTTWREYLDADLKNKQAILDELDKLTL